jgi:hypothetical protein
MITHYSVSGIKYVRLREEISMPLHWVECDEAIWTSVKMYEAAEKDNPNLFGPFREALILDVSASITQEDSEVSCMECLVILAGIR